VLYTIRSERLLVEQLNYNLLFRWFVGLSADARVWDHSTFSQNRGLCHMAHILTENRNGLIVDVSLSEANGTAERTEALKLLLRNAKPGSTIGADKGYDTRDFVKGCRDLRITPHVARKRTGSAIDSRTTRHEGYRISQRNRKRIVECFGWLKTVGGLRKTKLIGRAKLAGQTFLAFATYNLVRMGSLSGCWGGSHV
jgi:IS5 family transposase